ncbi:unnamed protein product [Thelazia callipaeda]|uniref:C2H2-type domain-containing protein n=1 Tax=Thelazia callipaeda TaxID=103827 RepID=A0A0N5D1H9_THECL|nr:unnamed protein product [Thelazia callipaeda]
MDVLTFKEVLTVCGNALLSIRSSWKRESLRIRSNEVVKRLLETPLDISGSRSVRKGRLRPRAYESDILSCESSIYRIPSAPHSKKRKPYPSQKSASSETKIRKHVESIQIRDSDRNLFYSIILLKNEQQSNTRGAAEATFESDVTKENKRKALPVTQHNLPHETEVAKLCDHERFIHFTKRSRQSRSESSHLLGQSSEISVEFNIKKIGVMRQHGDFDYETRNGCKNQRKEECGKYGDFTASDSHRAFLSDTRDIYIDNNVPYNFDRSGDGRSSDMLRSDRKPIPVTAPLLTTERTHIRLSKRKQDDPVKNFKEKKIQEEEPSQKEKNTKTSRFYYEDDKSLLDDVMYDEIGLSDGNYIETTFQEEELIYNDDDIIVDGVGEVGDCDDEMGTSHMQPHSVDDTQQEGKQANMIEPVNDEIESIVDEAPPELEPQSSGTHKISQRLSVSKNKTTNFPEPSNGMQVIRVQSPNGTEQFIQIASSETFVDDNGLYISDNDNVTSVRQDLRAVEFNFLDSKNICCGLCGEIVLYDLLLSTHIPEHHPEVLDEGVTAFEDVPYETWLREKLNEEKRRIENSMCNFQDDYSSVNNSGRIYRSVSTIRVNPNEMSLNQLITALRKKMFEKLGRSVPVTLVDKQHARCGICNAVVSLNRKFEVVHLVRHFNAWHPSVHKCTGKWKLKKQQPGLGKPLSFQDFAVIDTSLDRGANLQCIWCGMFMTSEALAMHFSEVHPEEIEVPKCNLCLQELVINARLLEKYGEDFDISLPDEHQIKCGKYGTTHVSESPIDKRLKLCGEGRNLSDVEDDETEDVGRASSYVNSRMTFGRRSKPKRQFIMPALRQAAPVNSRFVEAINDCHWRCKICSADILAAVISAGAIRHFRTEHPQHLHNMQYELCKTRLERISDGCMEFINPQLIECLVCNMTYMLHRPFNMCRAIRHLRSKHPDLMPEFASAPTLRALCVTDTPEGIITDPATIAMLKAQYGVDFKKVQALKGVSGEPVYVLLDEAYMLNCRFLSSGWMH